MSTRNRRGVYSPTSATAFGMMPPRPIPAMKRIVRNSTTVCARAVMSVTREKNRVVRISTGRRPILSASMLNTMEPTRIPKSAALNTGPFWAGASCQSLMIAGAR